jgi:hypothetical protein
MPGKLIMFASGPLVKYRLEILKRVCDKIKDKFIILTDRFSYNIYSDLHNDFNFVILDDLREKYPISIQHEQLLEAPTEKEHIEKLFTFYSKYDYDMPRLFPYDIHRFIFLYLIEQNILNFAIVDTDFVVANSPEIIDKFFDNIPSRTIYTLYYGEESNQYNKAYKDVFFQKEVQPHFPNISLHIKVLKTADGWMRGFHFENKDDMKLFFDIWNTAVEKLMSDKYWCKNLCHGHMIAYNDWLFTCVAMAFENKGYNNIPYYDLCKDITIGVHHTRPDDTFYFGKREPWCDFNFDYSDITSISVFVKNNKNQLLKYFDNVFDLEITDTHVYTWFKGFRP